MLQRSEAPQSNVQTAVLHGELSRDDGGVATLEGTDPKADINVTREAPQEDKGFQGGVFERNDWEGARKFDSLSSGTAGNGLGAGRLERAAWVQCVQPRGAKGPLRGQWVLLPIGQV